MERSSTIRNISAILLLIFLGQTIYYYQYLPVNVATHFNLSGSANGYMNKNQYLFFIIIMILVLTAVISSIAFVLPFLSKSAFNIPNKDYWLNEENYPRTISAVKSFLFGVQGMVYILLMWIQHFVFLANTTAEKRINANTIVLVLIFLVSILLWSVKLIHFFYTSPKTNSNKIGLK